MFGQHPFRKVRNLCWLLALRSRPLGRVRILTVVRFSSWATAWVSQNGEVSLKLVAVQVETVVL